MIDDIEEQLKRIFVEQLSFPISMEHLCEKTSLYGKGLGLNSLDVVSLIVRLEDEFEIYFEADEVKSSVENFGALLRTVKQKVNQNESGYRIK